MARHKPNFGHRSRHPLLADGQIAYSDSHIEALVVEYDIPEDKIDALREHLEVAAQIWRNHRHNFDDAPRPGNMLAAIDVLEDHIDGLRSSLEDLDDATADLFWWPNTDAFRRFSMGDEGIPPGHPAPSIRVDADGSRSLGPIQEDIMEVLVLLKAYCGDARRRLPLDKGGERPLVALNYWADNVCRGWTQVLGRELSYSKNKGGLMAFAVDSHKPVDPDQDDKRVMNAVQRVLERLRK